MISIGFHSLILTIFLIFYIMKRHKESVCDSYVELLYHLNIFLFISLITSAIFHILILTYKQKSYLILNIFSKLIDISLCVYGVFLIKLFKTKQVKQSCKSNELLLNYFVTILYCVMQSIPLVIECVFTLVIYPIFLCCFLSGKVSRIFG